MSEKITIGMARMHAEFGERRDFLPSFVARFIRRGQGLFWNTATAQGWDTQRRITEPLRQMFNLCHMRKSTCRILLWSCAAQQRRK